MPRGVYERKKKGQAAAKAPAAKKGAGPAKRNNVVALPSVDVKERFGILNQNLIALAQIRASLGGEGPTASLDAEIVAEIDTLSTLRKQHFGLTDAEQKKVAAESEVSNGSETKSKAAPVPPLPPQPVIPVPPVPAS